MHEVWKPLPWRPWIDISSLGRIRSNRYKGSNRQQVLKQFDHWHGYKRITFNLKAYYVHRLVAEVFIPNPNAYKQVNHKDGDKKNNSVDNLEWCNQQQNMAHARDIGLRIVTDGMKRGLSYGPKSTARLSDDEVREMRKQYSEGRTTADICRLFGFNNKGVDYNLVRGVVKMKKYLHVNA